MLSMLAFLVLGGETIMSTGGFVVVEEGQARAGLTDLSGTAQGARARQVLAEYVEQMTSVTLPSGDGISLVESPDLAEDGFRFTSEFGRLKIEGGTGKGLIYGAYELLERLGCRMWTETEIDVPQVDRLVIPELNETQEPKIKFRVSHYSHAFDQGYQEWHKLDSHTEDWGMWVHTFEQLLAADDYFEEHPEYYALIDGRRTPSQPELANESVFETVLANLKNEVGKRPGPHYWSVSQNDNVENSKSPESLALQERYGGASGEMVWFVNRIAEHFPDKTISTLAYQYTRQPPTNIRPSGNVNIMLCSIEALRHRPISEDPASVDFCADVAGWGELTDNILVWDYVIQFSSLISPFPNLRVLQPNLQWYVDQGVTAHFQQGNRDRFGEFSALRCYLISKLLWNPDLDFDAVMDEFLDGYYGAGGRAIRKYIDTMHDALEESGEGLEIFGRPVGAAYLSDELIAEYSRLFDEAEAAAAGDPVRFDRVRRARLPLTYAILEIAKQRGLDSRGLYDASGQPKKEMLWLAEEFVAQLKMWEIPRLTEWAISPDEYLDDFKKRMVDPPTNSISHGCSVELLKGEPHANYSQGGAGALTDGVLGGITFHVGGYLGFNGESMTAQVDLGEAKQVNSVSLGAHQDQINWIWHPKWVAYEGSLDGKSWFDLGTVESKTTLESRGFLKQEFDLSVDSRQMRYLKVHAESPIVCPEWHVGAGRPAFIFLDEIVVK